MQALVPSMLKTSTQMFKHLFSPRLRRKLPSKVWINSKEFNSYFRLVVWITSTKQHKEELLFLMSKIKHLYRKSGSNFTFLYLKECNRLIIRSLAGQGEAKFLKGICVSRDAHGLPHIIPSKLRRSFGEDQSVVRAVLSLVSMYRVMSTKVRPKLDTIVQPFNGVALTLSGLKEALRSLNFGTIYPSLRRATLLKIESAGPNAHKSA